MEDIKETKETGCTVMTNDEYREKLKIIFDEISDNKKLCFWYKYISAIEKG